MRKHGWQLPYHPLQVVAVAVFLALGFAFYVFFAPFVGKKLYQYIVMAVYTPLIACVLGLYIWCAAADPADPGVFQSKKYLKSSGNRKLTETKDSESRRHSNATMQDQIAAAKGDKSVDKDHKSAEDYEAESELKNTPSNCASCILGAVCCPCTVLCKCMKAREGSCEQQMSEDGMFYCSLCEVEVFKYSKHCRVCDKCVDSFDHHCRWINNCIGKRNYRKFFTLMVFSLLLLILQWSTGILVLICCFLNRKKVDAIIVAKLGSSFSIVPFIIVVALCTILAMLATLPIAQLFFFHILLIKKGISTYDYIIALREQEQLAVGGGQSPQMSQVSSLTGLSSASSFNRFHRAAWCTPPRLFLDNQYVVPPDTGSVSSYGKKTVKEEPIRKKNPAVKISPWTLARLNAAEVSKVAAEAKKKSQILKPVVRRGPPSLETDSSISSSRRRMVPRLDSRRRNSKRIRLPADLPIESLTSASIKVSNTHWSNLRTDASISLAPLQLEARSAFRTGLDMSRSANTVASSPESSLESPDIHPFHEEAEAPRHLTGLSVAGAPGISGLRLSRSASDGYEASGGEDSDRVPNRAVQRSANWSNLLFGSNRAPKINTLKASSSFSQEGDIRKPYP